MSNRVRFDGTGCCVLYAISSVYYFTSTKADFLPGKDANDDDDDHDNMLSWATFPDR